MAKAKVGITYYCNATDEEFVVQCAVYLDREETTVEVASVEEDFGDGRDRPDILEHLKEKDPNGLARVVDRAVEAAIEFLDDCAAAAADDARDAARDDMKIG